MIIYPPIYQTSSGTPRDLASLLSMSSQGFGANVAFYQKNLGTNGHTGIDFPCPNGTPVYASIPGTVSHISTDYAMETSRGAGVIIKSAEGECVEWHFERVDVSVGQQVVVGQQIGLSDDSGFSTGPHVHLEWRPYPLAYDNGFFGAVDPVQFMQWIPWAPLHQGIQLMNEQTVKFLYLAAFNRLPDADELGYWTGKDASDWAKKVIQDRAAFLQSELSAIIPVA